MTVPDHAKKRLAGALDEALREVDTAAALSIARSFVKVLERRLAIEAEPLDLFTLPADLPHWNDLYKALVERAIECTTSLGKAADVIGIGRSTLYRQFAEGLFDARKKPDSPVVTLRRALRNPVGRSAS